jgi:hypothetical protein
MQIGSSLLSLDFSIDLGRLDVLAAGESAEGVFWHQNTEGWRQLHGHIKVG